MYKQYEVEELKQVQKIQLEIMQVFSAFCDHWNLKYFLVFGTALGAVRHQGFIPWDDDIDIGMLREDYDRFIELSKEHLDPKYELLTPLINSRYCSTVTHLQKKGTRFVSEFAKNLKCDLGINIDIFAYDYIIDEPKKQKKQMLMTYFYGRLLFLCGSGTPEIPLNGITGVIARIICYLVHGCLVLFHIKSTWIYRRLLKNSIKYNNIKRSKVTCFEDSTPWKNIMEIEDIFPLKEISFEGTMMKIPHNIDKILLNTYGNYMELPPIEKRVNHMPVILDFGNEIYEHDN